MEPRTLVVAAWLSMPVIYRMDARAGDIRGGLDSLGKLLGFPDAAGGRSIDKDVGSQNGGRGGAAQDMDALRMRGARAAWAWRMAVPSDDAKGQPWI